jgi:3-dehydroquinate dehydratase-2
MAKILVLHGPNLNMLGAREPAVYGRDTLADIDARLTQIAAEHGHELSCLQSNAEHELVAAAQRAGRDGAAFIIINPAAFTHTSVALRDAVSTAGLPCIEVHLSNVFARESFRHHSYFSDIAVGVISGFGAAGYDYALRHAIALLSEHASNAH